MTTNTAFEEVKKAQNILMETIDKSARANLDAVQKLLELNKQRFSSANGVTNPSELVANQSSAFKDYAEAMSAHFENLTAIGTESREQLTELSQDFSKGLDFSSFFPFAETATKPKGKAGSKTS